MRWPWTGKQEQVNAAVQSLTKEREMAMSDQTRAARRLILVAMGRAAGEDDEVNDEYEQISH